MATKIQLWQLESATGSNDANEPVTIELVESLALSQQGARKVGRSKRRPRLSPIAPGADAVAAMLVPDDCRFSVCRNGIALSAGLHLVAHADRIETAGNLYFVSVEMTPDFDAYNVERHGADAYCFMTSTRVNAGDEIVICCGIPGVRCGKICRRQAWDRALERAAESGKRVKCANCSFDPAAAPWRPSVEHRSNTLETLMGMIAAGGLSA